MPDGPRAVCPHVECFGANGGEFFRQLVAPHRPHPAACIVRSKYSRSTPYTVPPKKTEGLRGHATFTADCTVRSNDKHLIPRSGRHTHASVNTCSLWCATVVATPVGTSRVGAGLRIQLSSLTCMKIHGAAVRYELYFPPYRQRMIREMSTCLVRGKRRRSV